MKKLILTLKQLFKFHSNLKTYFNADGGRSRMKEGGRTTRESDDAQLSCSCHKTKWRSLSWIIRWQISLIFFSHTKTLVRTQTQLINCSSKYFIFLVLGFKQCVNYFKWLKLTTWLCSRFASSFNFNSLWLIFIRGIKINLRSSSSYDLLLAIIA